MNVNYDQGALGAHEPKMPVKMANRLVQYKAICDVGPQ